ncbi:hypothetical protein D9M68_893070 [compost metagenome]
MLVAGSSFMLENAALFGAGGLTASIRLNRRESIFLSVCICVNFVSWFWIVNVSLRSGLLCSSAFCFLIASSAILPAIACPPISAARTTTMLTDTIPIRTAVEITPERTRSALISSCLTSGIRLISIIIYYLAAPSRQLLQTL